MIKKENSLLNPLKNGDFNVALSQFEGPLDLMLTLIQQNKLNLMDLDLSVLADQYITYINQQTQLDLASAYMVEFAKLLEFKSRLILPRREEDKKAEQEIVADYQSRLLLYQKYKQLATDLKNMQKEANQHLSRPENLNIALWKEQIEFDFKVPGFEALLNTYQKVAKKIQAENAQVQAVPYQELDISQRISQLLANRKEGGFKPSYFFEDCKNTAEVVITFLAVLEMIHQRKIYIKKNLFYYE